MSENRYKSLFEEEPFGLVLLQDAINSYCSYCLVKDKKLHKCSSCHYVKYCCIKCQKSDWTDHKYECKGLSTFKCANFAKRERGRLMARIVGQEQDPDLDKKVSERTFDDLLSHDEKIASNKERWADFLVCYELCNRLLKESRLNTTFEKRYLLKVYGKIVINGFSHPDQGRPIAISLCLQLSRLDHSCHPDCIIVRYGRTVALRSLAEDDTELDFKKNRIQYLPLDELGAWRRKRLLERYYFECDCDRCRDPIEDATMLAIKCEKNECNGDVLPLKTDDGDFLCNTCAHIQTTKSRLHEGVASKFSKLHLCQQLTSQLKTGSVVKRYNALYGSYMQVTELAHEQNYIRYTLAKELCMMSLARQNWKDALKLANECLIFVKKWLPPNCLECIEMKMCQATALTNLRDVIDRKIINDQLTEALDMMAVSLGEKSSLYQKLKADLIQLEIIEL